MNGLQGFSDFIVVFHHNIIKIVLKESEKLSEGTPYKKSSHTEQIIKMYLEKYNIEEAATIQ